MEDVPGRTNLQVWVNPQPGINVDVGESRIRMSEQEPLLYTELASWWPLLSPPSHYVEEAADLPAQLLTAKTDLMAGA